MPFFPLVWLFQRKIAKAIGWQGTGAKLLIRRADLREAGRKKGILGILPCKKMHQKAKKCVLSLPIEVGQGLEQFVEEEHTTLNNVVRIFCELGLEMTKVVKRPGGAVIVREQERLDKEIIFLP